MGFSAYILETLNRYGRADLGTLGSFVLDYAPAQWKVIKQNFDPPQAEVTWHPGDESTSFLLLARVVASLHDIPFTKAYEFVKNSIDRLSHDETSPDVLLGILGKLEKSNSSDLYQYRPNPDLHQLMKFEPLSIAPTYTQKEDTGEFNWWIVLGSAILLGTIFILLNFLFNSTSADSTAMKVNHPTPILENTSLKQTNIAPEPNLKSEDLTLDFADRRQSDFIIITGTFCQTSNAIKMKKKILRLGFNAYEQNLKQGCKRLGIIGKAGINRDSLLFSIRANIEPTAWILDQ